MHYCEKADVDEHSVNLASEKGTKGASMDKEMLKRLLLAGSQCGTQVMYGTGMN